MTVLPVFHWQFTERDGSVTKDVNGVEAKLDKCLLQFRGRIGNAIQVNGKNGALYLGKEAGQFGTRDFTIAFGIVVLNRNDDNNLDILGTRSSKSHGNWVSLLLLNKAQLAFEVDEDSSGKNYFSLKTDSVIDDHTWHHVALVREGLTLRIYVDGELKAEGTAPGVANINNDADMKVGDWLNDTPTARYEDLRIYHTALSAAEIGSLIPPARPVLRPGQIELVAVDQAAIVLSDDDPDLSRYSTEFQSLRLGLNTGVTLYKGRNFESVSQKLYADVANLRSTKLAAFPQSVLIWSSIGAPFTGKWIISAGNGQYLNQNKHLLSTSPQHLSGGFFSFQYDPQSHQTLLIPANDVEMPLLKVGKHKVSRLVVDDSELATAAFSIVHASGNQWLKLDGTLDWTDVREERTLFYRVMKIADSEEQVGEITEGEVALYQNPAYHGKAWVLSDYEPGVNGNFMSLKGFQGLDNVISSIRVGPNTGVTLFANENQRVDEAKRETELEDYLNNVPDMGDTQIKHDNASSLNIFRWVKPETIFTSYVSKLSEDYRMVGDNLEQFSAYRTTLRFATNDMQIEVSATDATTIEVDGTLYEIDEVRSVILQPNLLNRIMITSEAEGLSTPGLKFYTQDMAENERVVIFPHEDVHKQIAELEDDALWNAKDAEGNLIVDQNKHSREEIGAVQNTIKRAMATVVTTKNDTTADTNTQAVSVLSSVVSTQQVVSAAAIDNAWALNFQPRPNTGTLPDGSAGCPSTSVNIWEEPLSQDEFQQLRVQAVSIQARGVVRSIRDAVKNATRFVINITNNALSILIDGVEFLLDTVAKVADFVEALIEKVVESVKKFIEQLRFAFEWKDILKTKDYLANTVNQALDSVNDMVDDAKDAIADFVDTMQEDIQDGINSLIRLLDVTPSEVRKGPGLPESVEWLLSKILGGSKSKDARTQPLTGSNSNESTPMQQAFEHLMAAINDLVGIASRTVEGLFETIESLIVDPKRPELAVVKILETFRDVIIQALDLGENIIFAVLEALVAAVDLLRDFLNKEIKIPFITDLFKKLEAGNLTYLNLTTLLVSVPLTGTVKSITGKPPFEDLAQPEFPERTDPSLQRNATAQAEESEEESEIDVDNRIARMLGFGHLAIIADFINSGINIPLDLISEVADDEGKTTFIVEGISLVLSGLSWFGSFPGSATEPGGYPYAISKKKHRTGSRSDIKNIEDKAERDEKELLFWERHLWHVRSGILAADMAYFAASSFLGLPIQRLRRANAVTSGLLTLATIVDVGFTGKYLSLIPDDDDTRGLQIANEVISIAPGLFSLLRQPPEKNMLALSLPALAVINGLAAFSTPLMSQGLLEAAVADFREEH